MFLNSLFNHWRERDRFGQDRMGQGQEDDQISWDSMAG